MLLGKVRAGGELVTAPVENPSELSVREVYEMFLDAKKLDYTDETLRDYETRLRQFVEWAEDQDSIGSIGDITGWHLEQFKLFRQGQDLAPTTVKGQMTSLRVWLGYAADIEAVDDMLSHKVNVPKLDQSDETNDTMLEADDARALINHYRNSKVKYASQRHVVLELFWFTGARLGAIHSLDVSDYQPDEQLVWFRHHPESTPLKKKEDGERPVGLPAETCEVIDTYLAEVRTDKRDDSGRRPLLCGRQGRPAASTIQNWVYHATVPCIASPCPHGKEARSCEWTQRKNASQCPSSRSPHQIRTGSITWQLNSGLSFEAVGERVNSDPDTLRRYYDKASDVEKLEQRRRAFVDQLELEE
ncbi:phage integrase/site-specific recombinase [Haloarcula vallismortis ATCC 29715]|uniref:Phage integrase/site-specific recombinase n=1 Tax=Haloarcula vallismortis ATCC 29715 TaxID=662477 RepID=M0IYM6_HALVA|nr:site-specific integrase [Haloarcula vallismortis]EMA01836.1 phage integrase/site-specific recombinase [Haloarcula vallismortis ATCC 29715]